MANDLDTYWDFEDFLRSTVSEQKDTFAFSCPTQAGLQPQDVLLGGLWLSGGAGLLPMGTDVCSSSSCIAVSCSSWVGGCGQPWVGARGSGGSVSSPGVAGRVGSEGALGLDVSETCRAGREPPAAPWPFMWSFFMWCTTAAALKACWGGRQKPHGEHLVLPGWLRGEGVVPLELMAAWAEQRTGLGEL